MKITPRCIPPDPPPSPLEACFFGARLGNRSSLILDPLLLLLVFASYTVEQPLNSYAAITNLTDRPLRLFIPFLWDWGNCAEFMEWNPGSRLSWIPLHGAKGWRSGERTRCPPIQPRFKIPASTPELWFGLLLVLSFAPRGFCPGTTVFPSPQNPTFPNSNSTSRRKTTMWMC